MLYTTNPKPKKHRHIQALHPKRAGRFELSAWCFPSRGSGESGARLPMANPDVKLAKRYRRSLRGLSNPATGSVNLRRVKAFLQPSPLAFRGFLSPMACLFWWGTSFGLVFQLDTDRYSVSICMVSARDNKISRIQSRTPKQTLVAWCPLVPEKREQAAGALSRTSTKEF